MTCPPGENFAAARKIPRYFVDFDVLRGWRATSGPAGDLVRWWTQVGARWIGVGAMVDSGWCEVDRGRCDGSFARRWEGASVVGATGASLAGARELRWSVRRELRWPVRGSFGG